MGVSVICIDPLSRPEDDGIAHERDRTGLRPKGHLTDFVQREELLLFCAGGKCVVGGAVVVLCSREDALAHRRIIRAEDEAGRVAGHFRGEVGRISPGIGQLADDGE